MRIGPDPVVNHPVPGMHLWGWMSPEELTWLHEQAGSMESVVEIGSLHGRSAYALATATSGPVFCIDPWNDEGYASFTSSLGHLPNVNPMRMTSVTAGPLVPDVDMVFIDGDHAYASVVLDLDIWLPKTKRLICGHDYGHEGFEGVKRAVDERFDVPNHVVGDIWAVWIGEGRVQLLDS